MKSLVIIVAGFLTSCGNNQESRIYETEPDQQIATFRAEINENDQAVQLGQKNLVALSFDASEQKTIRVERVEGHFENGVVIELPSLVGEYSKGKKLIAEIPFRINLEKLTLHANTTSGIFNGRGKLSVKVKTSRNDLMMNNQATYRCSGVVLGRQHSLTYDSNELHSKLSRQSLLDTPDANVYSIVWLQRSANSDKNKLELVTYAHIKVGDRISRHYKVFGPYDIGADGFDFQFETLVPKEVMNPPGTASMSCKK